MGAMKEIAVDLERDNQFERVISFIYLFIYLNSL